MAIKVKNYFVEFSLPPEHSNKKYRATIYNKSGKKVKTLYFGQKGYQQYKDKTPLKEYQNLDHLDKKRRINYRRRHSKILKKDGTPAYQDPLSSSFYSWNFLW